jgi:hypothetical protein
MEIHRCIYLSFFNISKHNMSVKKKAGTLFRIPAVMLPALFIPWWGRLVQWLSPHKKNGDGEDGLPYFNKFNGFNIVISNHFYKV